MGAPAATAATAGARGAVPVAGEDRGPSGQRPTFERPGRPYAPAQPTPTPTSSQPGGSPVDGDVEEYSVLVFSETAGFRHSSIETGVAAVEQLGADNGFTVDWANDSAGVFTEENLARYASVVWLSTTGDVLDETEQAAFEGYIAAGGGYAGVHAASDTEYEWPWYGDLVGAYFDSHPQIQPAGIDVEDADHPSTAHLPERWERTDEWYNYQENPRSDVHVLATLDESSYDAGSGAMGDDHPIAWCQDVGEARSWYTGTGHTEESYAEPEFLQHLLGGIETTAGVVDADCPVEGDGPGGGSGDEPAPEDFEQVTLARGPAAVGEPMAMAVLPDGSVLHTSRDGVVRMTTADSTNTVAGRIPVYNHDEDGLQGIAVDPQFEDNRWVYLYYAPVLDTPAGDAPETGTPEDFAPFEGHNQLSRFQLGEDGVLDLASEQQILQVPADRGTCCHAGGEIDFDAEGDLYLSTGDDTNPFASDGFAPIDDSEGRNPAFDARRSAGSTNDLRGKLLRITVAEDGSYTVPEGNLFAEGTEATRPEIYVMGLRNPFRFSVDRETGFVHLGDYGPDAGAADPERGPAGTVEFNIFTGPGNAGWPYCVGENQPFADYDFATGESTGDFDCAAPVNDSRYNTGLTELPPVVPAWLPYDGESVPELGAGGESPMGGVVYDYDEALESETKWPEYFDGTPLLYEWDRGWIRQALLGEEGQLQEIRDPLAFLELRRPMNIEFGPDGALYVLDYGGGYFGGAEDSALYRVDYVQGNRSPQPVVSAEPTSGAAPLEVTLDATGSTHPDGLEMTYEWDVDNDGDIDLTGPSGTWTYEEAGQYTVRLVATDTEGGTGVATATVTVGNTAPQVELRLPADGGFFDFGDEVPFEVVVTDPEDGAEVDCSRVRVEYVLGHDNHGHPLSTATGCEGTIATPADEGHGLDAHVFGVVNATYTDGGAEGVPELTGSDEAVLNTKVKQAEYFTDSEGVQVVDNAGAAGGRQVGYIATGDWISFDPSNLTGIDGVSLRYASGGAGGTVEMRSGAVDGPLVGTAELAPTGGWEVHADTPVVPVTDPGGTAPLFLVFQGVTGQDLFDVDQLTFSGEGVAAGGGGQPPAECAPTTPDEGYTSLFDGTAESAAAWRQAGPGSFDLTEDCTLVTRGGLGLLWYPEEFESYSLTMDWQLTGDDNSGVFIGFDDPGDDPWSAVDGGYEVQIDATDEPDRTTGAIYTFQGADQAARDEALNPPGEWNSYEIVVQGQRVRVYLNEVLINDFTSTERDISSGYVGLQNHGDQDEAYFRDVQIRELATPGADETAPVTTAVTDPAEPDGLEGWFTTAPSVTLTATDEASEVASTEYRIDGGAWTPYAGAFSVPGDGEHVVGYRSTDAAGNVETEQELVVSLDATAPVTTLALEGAGEGWSTGDVTMSLTAQDETSGVAGTEYSLDGGDWTAYTGPVVVSGDGEHTVLYRSTDVAGNVEADQAATISIDATAPTLLVDGVADGVVYGDSTDVVVSWYSDDATSGDVAVTATLDGAPVTNGQLLAFYQLALGMHSLQVEAVDAAGNTTTQSVEFATTTSMRDISALLDRFRATNRISLPAYRALSTQLTEARVAEATGDDEAALVALGEFVDMVSDETVVRPFDVWTVLTRDAYAVMDAIEGVSPLSAAVNAEAAITG